MTQTAAPPHLASAIAMDRSSRLLLLASVAWLFVQGALRILTASSLGLDEAQLLVTTQSLEWGYGAQPPLYSWIQYGVFAVFGPTIPALVYTKEAMLAGTFLLFFLASRLVLGDERRAAIATLLLFTIPQIGWESQRALSHSVLVLLVAAAALYCFLRVLRNGRLVDYVWFGLLLGLGLLSKYNFGIFALALIGAAMLVERDRRRVLSLRFALSLLIAAAITAPHFYWGLTHLDLMLSSSDKFEIETTLPLLERLALPVLGAATAIASFSAVTALVMAIAAFAPPRHEEQSAAAAAWAEGSNFLIRLLFVSFAIVVATPLLSGATVVRDRWLMPVLFFLPLPLMIAWSRWLGERRLRLLAMLAMVSAVICSAGLTAAALLPDLVGRGLRGTEPYAAFAETIRQDVSDPAYILAEATNISGNLRLAFPRATVLTSSSEPLPRVRSGPVPILAAWTREETLPEDLRTRLARLCANAPLEIPRPVRLREPYEHSRTLFMEMFYVVIEDCEVTAQRPVPSPR